jgi:glycosyltransferase involved in cell wall biosynthesis
MKQYKFKIIVASYNNEDWVEYNLASIINQTYTNYHVMYVDDCSTDRTNELAKKIIGDNNKFTLVRNEVRVGEEAIYNYVRYYSMLEDDEIVVNTCGDDWLFDENVLANLNEFYNKNDVWLTYGEFYVYNGSDEVERAFPQNTEYPEMVHRHKLYRRDTWRASHMLTIKGFLAKRVDLEGLKSMETGKYYYHAPDLALVFPLLEMCPKDKIGVVDFPTYVWNGSQQCQVRTKDRESTANVAMENEVRNRKQYKEGLSGEKLPQVNVFYDYMELTNFPKLFTHCYKQEKGEYDMVLIMDWEIPNYIAGKIKVKNDVPIVARLAEHRSFWKNEIYDLVLQHYDMFDTILTHDKNLLEQLPNAKFMPAADCIVFNKLPNPIEGHTPFKCDPANEDYELPDDIFQIYPKNKLVSVMASDKAWLPGHVQRLRFLDKVKHKVDVYGTCQRALFGRELRHETKFLSLKNYAFSIAIENLSHEVDDYYFTEKIVDCFTTGTVPIYYGCPNIGKFFDTKGILIFENEEQLNNILDNLSMDLYYSMMDSIKHNYEVSMKMNLTCDLAYEYYYKDIIDNFKK